MKSQKSKKTMLDRKDIEAGTEKGLKRYEGLDFLSRVGMFIGMSQILEFGLKRLMEELYGVPLEQTEKWTLAGLQSSLRQRV